jgi:hypothetical protein
MVASGARHTGAADLDIATMPFIRRLVTITRTTMAMARSDDHLTMKSASKRVAKMNNVVSLTDGLRPHLLLHHHQFITFFAQSPAPIIIVQLVLLIINVIHVTVHLLPRFEAVTILNPHRNQSRPSQLHVCAVTSSAMSGIKVAVSLSAQRVIGSVKTSATSMVCAENHLTHQMVNTHVCMSMNMDTCHVNVVMNLIMTVKHQTKIDLSHLDGHRLRTSNNT